MGATETIKEFVRIAATAGLSKDVIDLLDKKTSLLAEQVALLEQEKTSLLRENRNLKSENKNLKTRLQEAKPKPDQLSEQTAAVLRFFFDHPQDISDPQVARKFQISEGIAGHHTGILLNKRLISQTTVGIMGSPPQFQITAAGREYCVKNGLAS
jgi:regulator of replication initiation timing